MHRVRTPQVFEQRMPLRQRVGRYAEQGHAGTGAQFCAHRSAAGQHFAPISAGAHAAHDGVGEAAAAVVSRAVQDPQRMRR